MANGKRKKLRDKAGEWIQRHQRIERTYEWVRTKLRPVVFAIFFLIGLAWIINSLLTVGVDDTLSIVAIFVASIAAIASLLAWQWARNTMRPFVFFTGHIDVGGEGDKRHVTFHIRNSGLLPASNVRVKTDPFGTDEEVTIGSISKMYRFPEEKGEPIIIFPNLEYQAVEELDLNKLEDKNAWESMLAGKVKLRIKISYTSLRRRHETIQSIHIDQFDAKKAKLWGLITEPQMWK